MELFKKRKGIRKAWHDFFLLNKEDITGVSNLIKESWERTKSYKIDVINKKAIEEDRKVQKASIEKNSNFIDIARPYMIDLYNIIKESGFMITLTDKDGYILDTIISPNISKNSNIELANLSEKRVGTNAMGTCLYLNKPVETLGEENYYKGFHEFTTSAAPIHDEVGEIIGCIGITGYADTFSLHTLGMATAMASAIENKININKVNQNKTEFLNDAVSDGVIVVDKECNITSISKKAMSILGVKNVSLEGMNLKNIIKGPLDFEKIIKDEIDFYNKKIPFQIEGKTISCDVSITNLKNNLAISGLVIVIKKSDNKFLEPKYSKGKEDLFTFDDIVGESFPLKEAINLAKIVSKGKSNVLIMGESGTGKELFAQSIHNNSPRKDKPFIPVNCGALPVNLVESELFGYEGGSYTGAKKEGHPGKFELADGGTLFLDEIGEMPLSTQAALLRVIQEKKVYRIGATKGKDIDIMIIAATNKNLFEAVQNNEFRGDLFYRLNVFSINIPPLRERKEDIYPLCHYFIHKHNQRLSTDVVDITEEAMEILKNYDWHGNVRELENTIERAVQISQNQFIEVKDLPRYIQNKPLSKMNTAKGEMSFMEEKEYKTILEMLENSKGNVKKAADALGIGRATMYRKLTKYKIDVDKIRN